MDLPASPSGSPKMITATLDISSVDSNDFSLNNDRLARSQCLFSGFGKIGFSIDVEDRICPSSTEENSIESDPRDTRPANVKHFVELSLNLRHGGCSIIT